MSTAENVMSSVMIVMIFVVLGILIYHSTTAYVITDYNLEKEEHLHDLYSNDLNTVMLVTEPISGRSMANLVADALYYREEVLNYSGKGVNVSQELKLLFDDIYGSERYYFEIKPRIIEVSLNFVIDGSNSLNAERKTLAKELPSIIEKIKRKINKTGDEIVIANIYILGDSKNADDLEKCNVFDITRKDILCKVISFDDIYLHEEDNNNATYNSGDYLYYKHEFNITPPFSNLTRVREVRIDGEKDYYEADWGSGTAYASAANKGKAKLVIIFPMGDELSTSSIDESCFNVKNIPTQKICDICNPSCSTDSATETELRSLRTVDKAIAVAKANNHLVNPIFAYNCDYDYKPMFNIYYEIKYGIKTSNACVESNCDGCSINEGVCFHPECRDEIVEQMNILAEETFGKLIDLKEISELTYNVEKTINQNIDEYKISVGIERNETIVRHVLSRALPLPDKLMTNAKLILYPEVEE